MTLKQHILAFLMDPNVPFLLFTIGLLCIYFEFNHPGAVIPGVVGFIAVLLSLYALNLLPFRSISLVLIICCLCVLRPGSQVPDPRRARRRRDRADGVGRAAAGGWPDPADARPALDGTGVSMPMGAITVFLMTIALKARRNKVVTGEQGMIGEVAIVCAPLTPAGKVFVQGELWDAVAPANVEAGGRVVIRRVENLVLHVEPVHEPVPQASVAG